MDLSGSNGRPVEPLNWVRYFIYEDNTRRRAWYRQGFLVDDRMLRGYAYGQCFRVKIYHPVELPEEVFVVANKPKLIYPDEPNDENQIVPQFDVYLVPREQWMLYQHLDPDEVDWQVTLLVDKHDG